MSLLSDLVKFVYPLALQGLEILADSQIDGAKLNSDQKKSVYYAYLGLKMWGVKFVTDTENPYDDQAVQSALRVAEKTLGEAGVPLPSVPPELETEPSDE